MNQKVSAFGGFFNKNIETDIYFIYNIHKGEFYGYRQTAKSIDH